MSGITPETVVVAARGQVSVDMDGEFVILGLADEVYYGLKGVGARVWTLLEEPRSVAQLASTVAAEFAVDVETAERDLLALVADLADRRLVDVVGAGAS